MSVADRRDGDDPWIAWRVARNGVICVAWQQFSVGNHRAGEVVDVHLRDRLLEVWSGRDLIKTMVCGNTKEVRKKRASRPAQS